MCWILEELSPDDRALLDSMDEWRAQGGSILNVIAERFHIPPTEYFQRVAALIDNPAALAYRPLLVNRLRRLQEKRGRAAVMRRGAAPR